MSHAAVPHAVSRLRVVRLARSSKPFLARGGPRGERYAGCRLVLSHCLCALRPAVPTQAGLCLLMAGDTHAAQTLEAYLEVFTLHYPECQAAAAGGPGRRAHLRLRGLPAAPSPHA